MVVFNFKDHQRRGSCGKRPASRQRRLKSTVADATRRISHAYRGFKPTAKFKRRRAWQECLRSYGVEMKVYAIEHLQLAMPPNGEEAARSFYIGVLGLTEKPKP